MFKQRNVYLNLSHDQYTIVDANSGCRILRETSLLKDEAVITPFDVYKTQIMSLGGLQSLIGMLQLNDQKL